MRATEARQLEVGQTEPERYRTMAEAARQAEADLWEPAGIVPGAHVADVGCGPGAMLPALAAAVGPDGRVTALDADAEAVAAARALVAAASLGNVGVQQGRADATGLAGGSLEVVMLRPPTFFSPMLTAVDRRPPNVTPLGSRLGTQGSTLPDTVR